MLFLRERKLMKSLSSVCHLRARLIKSTHSNCNSLYIPTHTWRNNNVIIATKRVVLSFWRHTILHILHIQSVKLRWSCTYCIFNQSNFVEGGWGVGWGVGVGGGGCVGVGVGVGVGGGGWGWGGGGWVGGGGGGGKTDQLVGVCAARSSKRDSTKIWMKW